MIDYENIRLVIAKGLKEYLKCPVIRSNQNSTPPAYPFVPYTITTLMSENKGTYGEYDDGTARKPFTQIWSISALSDDNAESVMIACKAREWFDKIGTGYLNDNDIIVQSVSSVTNRDNVISVEYEYKNGFDVVLWLYDTTESSIEDIGTIEEIEIKMNDEYIPIEPDIPVEELPDANVRYY